MSPHRTLDRERLPARCVAVGSCILLRTCFPITGRSAVFVRNCDSGGFGSNSAPPSPERDVSLAWERAWIQKAGEVADYDQHHMPNRADGVAMERKVQRPQIDDLPALEGECGPDGKN